MRIGYFTNTYPRATNTYVQGEVKALRERGVDVRTFSLRKTGSEHDVSEEVIAEKNNTIYLLPANFAILFLENIILLSTRPARYFKAIKLALKSKRSGFRGLLLQILYFQEAIIIARELRRQKIKHLHNLFGEASGTVTMLACLMANVSYSIAFHGPHIFFEPFEWALRLKVKYSSFITCISYYCQSQLMLFSDKSDWHRFKIIHCGINPEHFKFTEVKRKARKLLYAGRLAHEKGLPVLFDSLKLLKEEGYDYELTLVGDGGARKYLEDLACETGISDRLIFAGFANQDEVRNYMLQSDIFILPSLAEGVPVSLMEAMSCGIPVLATYVGGIVELIESEKTGLLVSPSDPIALKNAIIRYLEDHELRKKVSHQGRKKVVSEFNLDKEVNKLAQLFKSQIDCS